MTDIIARLRSRPDATFLDETAAREIEHLRAKLHTAREALWVAQNDYAHADPHSPFVRALEETK